MTIVYTYAIRHPYRTLAMTLLIAAAAAPGLTRLKIRTDGHALVPPNAPPVKLDAAIRKEFGLKDTIVVVVRSSSAEGVFNPHTLAVVDELTAKFFTIPGIGPADVFSLATEKGHRVKPGTLQFLRYFDPVPSTPQQCQTLQADLHLIGIYKEVLLSEDEKSTAIIINVPEGSDRIAFYRHIRRILDQTPHAPDVITVTGAPVAESLLGTHILEDLGVRPSWFGSAGLDEPTGVGGFPRTLDALRDWIGRNVGILSIALGVMAIVFFVSFRSVTAVALTLVKVGGCLLIVFALMGWFDVPIYLTIAVMPVILTATGVSDEVHIFDRYARLLRERPNESHIQILMVAMDEMWRPVVLTSVTTAFGFLSFAASPLAPVRAFGIFTSLGSMLCMMWALTATPALVSLMHPRRFRERGGDPRGTSGAGFQPVISSPVVASPFRRFGVSTFRRFGVSAFWRFGVSAFRRFDVSTFRRFSMRHSPLYARLADWIPAHRRTIFAAFVILLGLSALGMKRVYVQDSWIDGFSPASQFHGTTKAFNDQFLGMHVLFVKVDTNSQTLTGELDSSMVDHFTVKLPANLVSDPAALVGQSMELRLASPPADLPADSVATVHRADIESAVREGDRLIVSFVKAKGSPRFTLGVAAGDRVRYRIAPEPFLRPDFLKKVKALEEFVAGRSSETVGGTLGPAKYVETTHFIGFGCREEFRRIPERDTLELVWRWYGSIRGMDRLRATVDADFSKGVISVYMKNANFVDTARLLDLIRDYERRNLTPPASRHVPVPNHLAASLSFAGDVAVSQTLIGAITATQISSIALSILAVFASAAVIHRSLKWGLLCTIPAAFAVPLTFGLMGFAGIPLGVATSMFAAMAVGIGDDYAIHMIERFRLACVAPSVAPVFNRCSARARIAGARILSRAPNDHDAIRETLVSAGPANVIDALSVALGFGVLTLSQVPANARLGAMVIASIVTCLAGATTLLPAILSMMRQRTIKPDAGSQIVS